MKLLDWRLTASGCALVLVAAAAFQGCNVFAGLDDVKFEEKAGSSGAAGSSPTTGGSAGSAGSATSAQGGSGAAAGTSGSAGSAASGATTSSSGGTGGSTSSSSSSGGSAGDLIHCGNDLHCEAGKSVCCWDEYGGKGVPESGECLDNPLDLAKCDTSTLGQQGLLECETAAQCGAAQLCCGHTVNGPAGLYYPEVRCQDACAGANTFRMCMGLDDVTTCEAGMTCATSNLLPAGFFRCK
jgi:hypothetical protein